MKAKRLSLAKAPELTIDELKEIEIAGELFQILPLEWCEKHKIFPLSKDPSSNTFSFLFVDPNIENVLSHFKQDNGFLHLCGYKIDEKSFQYLLQHYEGNTHNYGVWSVALIEPDSDLKDAFEKLLQAQGYHVTHFNEEDDFKLKVKELEEKLKSDDDILNLAESQRLIPFQAVLVRRKALKSPATFCQTIWAHLNHLRVSILEENWLHRIFEQSSFQEGSGHDEFSFHIKHEDYYHAAIECLKKGNVFQAVELLEQVQPKDSHYIKAKALLGKAFLKKKNYNKAAMHFQKAYDHWCQDPEATVDQTVLKLLYHLAYTFEKMNRQDDALKLYERVAAEDPAFRDVNQRLIKVKDKRQKAIQAGEKKMGLPAFSTSEKEQNRYEKMEEIGKGGMGLVYRAKDRVLGREVALKILNSHFKHDEKIVETFLREAKSLASLNHLNIVTIFDAGIEDGNYYISMEFIEGKTVREILRKKGNFRLSTTMALSRQILKALAYAHSKQVIHRDITTNNMMLTETKIVKLMDFGLARVVNQLHSEQSIIGGTPYFMSPEQVEGAPIDHRTDIYSFGVCLYEILTGQVPFPMENPGYHHLHTPPPNPKKLKPELPDQLCEIILKCLEKKPHHRYERADDLLEALRSLPIETIHTVSRKPKGSNQS